MHIIAGRLKGRRVQTLKSHAVRPTKGKVREAAMNLVLHAPPEGLEAFIEGQAVADICCGSGALGFEALSRGAAAVTFVDAERTSLDIARENAENFGVQEQCRFLLSLAERLPSAPEPHSVVFLDPPYGKDLTAPILCRLAEKGWLHPGGMAVVELSARDPLPEIPGYTPYKERSYGKTRLLLLRHA